MPSEWRYALKPLPVDANVKKLAQAMTRSMRIGTLQRARQASSVAEGSAEERMRRIVRGLRARVTEPGLQAHDHGPDDDPSSRN